MCDQTDSPFDDNLANIAIPTLYVGAEGSFGSYGQYILELLGSSDTRAIMVSKLPAVEQLSDFGHVDLWLAKDAQRLVWRPIKKWLLAH